MVMVVVMLIFILRFLIPILKYRGSRPVFFSARAPQQDLKRFQGSPLGSGGKVARACCQQANDTKLQAKGGAVTGQWSSTKDADGLFLVVDGVDVGVLDCG